MTPLFITPFLKRRHPTRNSQLKADCYKALNLQPRYRSKMAKCSRRNLVLFSTSNTLFLSLTTRQPFSNIHPLFFDNKQVFPSSTVNIIVLWQLNLEIPLLLCYYIRSLGVSHPVSSSSVSFPLPDANYLQRNCPSS